MKDKFSDASVKAGLLLSLIPSVIIDHYDYFAIADTLAHYHDDLPSPEVVQGELLRWKNHCIRQNSQKDHKSPEDFASAIKACDKDVFPNIHTLLK